METHKKPLTNWDVTSEGRNELIFEDKNKTYGAYVIRKKYNHSVLIGVLISFAFLSLTIVVPLIKSLLSDLSEEKMDETTEVVMELKEPVPLDKITPITPPPPPPPPLIEQIKFTPPEVTEEDLPDDEIPPVQEKLSETNLGEKSQEGDAGAVDLTPIDDQGNNDLAGVKEDNTIYNSVQQNAEYLKGGMRGITDYIVNNYKEYLLEQLTEIGGTIYVSFVISKDGDVSDVKVSKGIKNSVLENEAVRVIRSLPGKWKPGKINGKPVNMNYSIPISFSE